MMSKIDYDAETKTRNRGPKSTKIRRADRVNKLQFYCIHAMHFIHTMIHAMHFIHSYISFILLFAQA